MIRLNEKIVDEVFEIPLSMEVVLKCRILDSASAMFVKSKTRSALKDSSREDVEEFMARFEHELMIQTGIKVIVGWEGVEQECNPADIRALLVQSPWGERFAEWYQIFSDEVTARKNGYTTSPSGKSEEVDLIAKNASNKGCLAPEVNVEQTATSALT